MSDISSRAFNADKEAEKIEHLAKERLDTSNGFFSHSSREKSIAAAERLAQEWSSLSFSERVDTANALDKYDNHSFDSLPRPYLLSDKENKFIGIEFYAAALDWHSGPNTVRLLGESGTVTVSSGIHRVPLMPFGYNTDCAIREPHGTLDEKQRQISIFDQAPHGQLHQLSEPYSGDK